MGHIYTRSREYLVTATRRLIAGTTTRPAIEEIGSPISSAGCRHHIDRVTCRQTLYHRCQVRPHADSIVLVSRNVENRVLVSGMLPALRCKLATAHLRPRISG